MTAEIEHMKIMEKRLDEGAFAVKRDVMNGPINPTVLDNLLACVDIADNLVDDYHYLAREITRISRFVSGEHRVPQLDLAFTTILGLADKSFATKREGGGERNQEGG